MGGSPRASAFVHVEFSEKAHKVYAKRIWDWAKEQACAEGKSLKTWKEAQEFGPEYQYYIQTMDCEKAQCSVKEDDAMIRAEVDKQGGWGKLSRRMAQFRVPSGNKEDVASPA